MSAPVQVCGQGPQAWLTVLVAMIAPPQPASHDSSPRGIAHGIGARENKSSFEVILRARATLGYREKKKCPQVRYVSLVYYAVYIYIIYTHTV